MFEQLIDWYRDNGFHETHAARAAWWTSAGLLVLSAMLLHFALRLLALRVVRPLAKRLQLEGPQAFLEAGTLRWLVHMIPAAFLHSAAPGFLGTGFMTTTVVQTFALLYVLLAAVLAIFAFIDGGVTLYEKRPVARQIPATSFVQVIKLVIALVALVLTVSILIGKSPLIVFSGLGAMTAVLLLIFKDAILGFVAGIQLAANRMIAVGDWIEMPKYGADGDVEEVALTTVKVRNWDKTRTTVPTYALISDSFKNWRGMQESGGRRIKRALYIDMDSVRLLDDELRIRLNSIRHLKEYFEMKDREIAEWNERHGATAEGDLNRRCLTNLGTFRAYILNYLRNHPRIHQQLTLLVRQLPPDERGLPLEIYCFTNDVRWAEYETIQADLFDHLIAVAREFDLRIFQNPSGSDLRALVRGGGLHPPGQTRNQ